MKPVPEIILAIESSCDDTAAAIVVDGVLQSSVIASQSIHAIFGGVVPELASRDHQRLIVPVVEQAMKEANVQKQDVSVVAVTYGPGLAGSLLVGVSFAKAVALGLNVPLVGINHMEGHIYSVFVEGDYETKQCPLFPFLCLTVSGGHTELTIVEEGFKHTKIGKTFDDAAGEAFDKVGKMLGLGYPAGPKIDQLAQTGNPKFHDFPRTRTKVDGKDGLNFSFSGLKTAVLYYLQKMPDMQRNEVLKHHLSDVCASFQAAVVDVLLESVRRAVEQTGIRRVAVVGGVSANSGLRKEMKKMVSTQNISVYIPPLKYCMDNAAMIGMTAYFKYHAGITSSLELNAEPNLSV